MIFSCVFFMVTLLRLYGRKVLRSQVIGNVWLRRILPGGQFLLSLFETEGPIFNAGLSDSQFDTLCNNLFENNRDWYTEEEYDSNGVLLVSEILRPPLGFPSGFPEKKM